MFQGREAEMARDGLAHVGEAGADADRMRLQAGGPENSTGTCSRVWSVPLKVGSQP